MTTSNKPVLGYRNCPDCGQRATIHQAGGRRGSLYQRCGCGCVQSSGRLVQSRMWHETDWIAGLQPVQLPANVAERDEYRDLLAAAIVRGAAPPVGQPDLADRAIAENPPAPAGGQQTDFTPVATPASEAGEPVSKPGKKGWLFAVLAGVALALAAAARAAKVSA